MKKNTRALTILIIAIIATLGVIWGHSLLAPENSDRESLAALERLRPFLELFVGKGNVTNLLVRKLAHFLEFMLLGAEASLLFCLVIGKGTQSFANAVFSAFAVAAADETIQIFSGRGSSLLDVWLDLSGALIGSMIVYFIIYIISKTREKE